jgi:hypothetical protein
MANAVRMPHTRSQTRRPWLRIFLVGLVLWLATVVVTFLTATRT